MPGDHDSQVAYHADGMDGLIDTAWLPDDNDIDMRDAPFPQADKLDTISDDDDGMFVKQEDEQDGNAPNHESTQTPVWSMGTCLY